MTDSNSQLSPAFQSNALMLQLQTTRAVVALLAVSDLPDDARQRHKDDLRVSANRMLDQLLDLAPGQRGSLRERFPDIID